MPRTTINDWAKIKEKIIECTNKNKKSFHPGKVTKYKDLEEKLNNFFEYNRKLGNAVTYKTLIPEMKK